MLRLCAALLLQGALVHGHGHVEVPACRAQACMKGANKNCGQVQYEAWSVEGPDRYPDTNPPDGKLASGAATSRFPELDEQSTTRWSKVPASSGPTSFTWLFQANHATKDFRYFITKDGWNPNAPLARASFEPTPFCSIERGGALPPMRDTHSCVLPQKSGYHIVYAVWDVFDTSNSFYNVIDMQFSGGSNNNPMPPPPPPSTPYNPPVPAPYNPPTQPAPAPYNPPPQAPGGCPSVIGRWGGCLHKENCCASGNTCKVLNRWFAQCVPGGSPSSPPAPTPQAPAPAPWGGNNPPPQGGGSGGCSNTVSRWGSCLANPSCCASGTYCYKQNKWYAQCLKDTDHHAGYTRVS